MRVKTMEEEILSTKRALNRLNFGEIIKVKTDNVENYSFEEYLKNGGVHKIEGVCNLCQNCNKSKNQKGTLLTVSHGSHSIDYFAASSFSPSSDWHTEPVMFVLENPGPTDKFYQLMDFGSFKKMPTTEWYWIHKQFKDRPVYPEYFSQGNYDNKMHSIINTFKLKNAYVTDIIKCGIIDDLTGEFIDTDQYTEECKNECIQNIFLNEVEILNPKVIFVFGKRTGHLIKNYTNLDKNLVIELPHPGRGNHSSKYFKDILNALKEKNIINETEYESSMKKYLGI